MGLLSFSKHLRNACCVMGIMVVSEVLLLPSERRPVITLHVLVLQLYENFISEFEHR